MLVDVVGEARDGFYHGAAERAGRLEKFATREVDLHGWTVEPTPDLYGLAVRHGEYPVSVMFGKRLEGGMHHLTFLVDDVRAAFERFAAHGYEPFGADQEWFQMFVHPRRSGGVLLQLMRRQAAQGRADRLGMTVEDVLAGRGYRGTGVSSP